MFRMLIALLYCAIPLTAQPWDDLRVLKTGDAVKVQSTDGNNYNGKFRSLSSSAIAIEVKRSEVSVERTRVRRVEAKSAARRWRNAAIGAGIGLAVGLLTDMTLGQYLRNEYSEGGGARALTYIVPIGLFAGIGAVP